MPDHALVVGGTRGLGRVVVERFLSRGLTVSVLSRGTVDAQDPRVRHFAVDLETLSETADLAQQVRADGGPLQYVVFCQRYRGTGDPWKGEIQVGLTATKLLIDGLAPHFCGEGDRAIAIVSSVYAEFVGSSQPVGYHVAKAGINQLIRYYAWELGRKGIRVNGIMPLTYLKDESREFYRSKPELLRLYERFVPLRRVGEADDSANALDFLCSDKAGFINGQTLFLDGGVSIVWQEELAKSLQGL
jgi:NAD(P)-dependent dehydrogenase (short-subunit alcohol dehydrogenase family)